MILPSVTIKTVSTRIDSLFSWLNRLAGPDFAGLGAKTPRGREIRQIALSIRRFDSFSGALGRGVRLSASMLYQAGIFLGDIGYTVTEPAKARHYWPLAVTTRPGCLVTVIRILVTGHHWRSMGAVLLGRVTG